MKKQTIALILVVLFFLQISAFAVTPDSLEEKDETVSLMRYTYLEEASATLTVSGKTSTYSLSAYGNTAVTSMYATMQLQMYVGGAWSNYGQSWSASASGNTLRTSGTKEVTTGYSWRLKATITLYTANGNSTETVYS